MLKIMGSMVFLVACAAPARGPAAVAPTLPSADALRDWMRDGNPRTAKVDLCVRPDGAVSGVRLAASSGDEHYDAAVVHDAMHWRHALKVAGACERAVVTYVP